MTLETATIDALKSRIAGATESEFRGQARVVVSAEQIYAALEFLHGERGFDFLADISCVDYLHYRGASDRFGLVYNLVNTVTNERLIVRTFLNEPDLAVPSVTPLWEGANWMEREVWDMFGITFAGHPDHRRILLPEEFAAFPLRKDYPLQGRGERHNFPVITRDSA
ncbi:MAG TPA: NADH-quinone oxidoreductase subunit C [Pirellulales bacterium]|nr:NADH-quinone oxidoreductase subunit C [Pirellulales bacterium]